MLTFILVLILVFAAVDLFVQLIINPMALKSKGKRMEKISTSNTEPIISLVGATMYDGGKSKENKEVNKSSGIDITDEKTAETNKKQNQSE